MSSTTSTPYNATSQSPTFICPPGSAVSPSMGDIPGIDWRADVSMEGSTVWAARSGNAGRRSRPLHTPGHQPSGLLAFGCDRHGVADGGTVEGDGAVAAGHGGAQLGDWLVGPGLDDLHPAGDDIAGADRRL